MTNVDKVLEGAKIEAIKTTYIPKSIRNMTINQNKEDLNRAIELLKECQFFLKFSKTYKSWGINTESELVMEIKEFLNQIEENDTRNNKIS